MSTTPSREYFVSIIHTTMQRGLGKLQGKYVIQVLKASKLPEACTGLLHWVEVYAEDNYGHIQTVLNIAQKLAQKYNCAYSKWVGVPWPIISNDLELFALITLRKEKK